MAGSAPARRCSFPRWCTVPVACCSKTPETGLHGDDTVFAVLPPRARDCAQTRLTVSWWIGKPWISGNLVVRSIITSMMKRTASWDLWNFFRNRRWFFANFSFGWITLLMVEISNIWNFERFGRNWWELKIWIWNFLSLSYQR